MQTTNKRSLEKILLPATLALGFVHAWIGRYSMNPDGVSYLDIGDALVRRDWANAVNAYWSPLYAWILGLVVGGIQPSPKWEFPLVHLVNSAIFVFALLAFRFFLHSILIFCHTRRAETETNGTEVLPDWVIVLLGYALFLWASLELETLYDVSPDLMVLSCVCLTAGMMLRLQRNPTLQNFAWVGLLLSLGYWAKAVLFPLGFASLALIYLWGRSSRSWRRGTAVATLVFICASAPLVFMLSRQKSRFTFGDSGKLNYAWAVSPQTFWRNWQGETPGSGTPAHPTRQLLQIPPAFEFDGPVSGTYPPWTDPSYWNEGLRWHFSMRPQVQAVVTNFATEVDLLLRAQPGLVIAVIVLALLSGGVWFAGLRELWPLIALPAAAFAIYLPVHVEGRFLGGFVLVLFLALFAAVRLRQADQRSAGYVAIAVFVTMALGTADVTLRYATHHLAIPGSGPDSAWQDVLAAEHLQKMGARPGDKVAVIGDGTGAYWARLAKLRIVAEVMGANHGSAQFWGSPEETKERVYAAFSGAGASLAVASCPTHTTNDWQPILGTDYCVLRLDPAVLRSLALIYSPFMCGIFGILARNGSIPANVLEQATDSLAHRGPDDRGTVVLQAGDSPRLEIGLGSRRLAILDLSPLGHQPMQDAETGNWIVYNGEIYNFRELRTRLQGEGVRFVSQSDTEVLLKAYGRWGEKCLGELRGMFAFAIWDAKRSRLLLGRDPMGIKPLYYCSAGQYFLFASELRTLLGTRFVPRRLDPAGLINYLNFGSVYDPITMIAGVSSLEAGHYAVWENGRVTDSMYWDLAPHGRAKTAASYLAGNESARKNLVDEVYATLDQAVRMQTVSDVPVGLFLSGGIDSSSLAGILSRAGIRLNTFSIIFREAEFSEAEYSRVVARAFASEHQEILVSQRDVLDAIPYALKAMDQPTIDGLNTFLISRQTRAAGIKVALSGLGGDELFAGYSTFRDVPRMERFDRFWGRFPSILRRPLMRMFASVAPDSDQNRKLTALGGRRDSALHPYFLARALFTPEQRDSLLASVDQEALARANAPLLESLRHASELDPVNRVSYLESRCYMLNTLLRDSDVMSMAHGLELRVPLIDHALADKMLALPGAWKLDGNVPKPLLVGALKGALPNEIVQRKKQGFTLPFERWLRENLRAEMAASLPKLGQGPLGSLLNHDSVTQVWDDFLSQRTSWSRIWSLYVLERWCALNAITA